VKKIIESRSSPIELENEDVQYVKKTNSEIKGEFEPNKDEIVTVINMAIDAEKKAQERYSKIAEMIEEDESKIIFQNLVIDEKNHQRILEDEFYHLSNKGTIIWE
jgi:rubrerythrin